MLDDRDVLVGVLSEMRSETPSGIAGLRSLLGSGDFGARSAQLPETRLADAERLIELIRGTTETAVAVSNVDTGVLYAGETVILALIEDVTDRYPDVASDESETFPLIR